MGTGILYAALAMSASTGEWYREIRDTISEEVAVVTGSSNDISAPSIDREDWAEIIKAPFFTDTICYVENFYMYVGSGSIETAKKIPVYVVSEGFYGNILGIPNADPLCAYIGKNALNTMSSPDVAVLYGMISWDREIRTLGGIPLEAFVPFENGYNKRSAYGVWESNILAQHDSDFAPDTFDDSIIFPLSAIVQLDRIDGKLIISIDKKNPGGTEAIIFDIMDILSSRHPTAAYHFMNPFDQISADYNYIRYISNLLSAASLLILAIMLFGFVGLLTLIVNKRNVSMSVCHIFGAPLARLAGELFLEVSVVVFSGATIGFIFASVFVSTKRMFSLPVYNSVSSVFTCILVLLAICVIVSAAGVRKILYLSPIKSLKSM